MRGDRGGTVVHEPRQVFGDVATFDLAQADGEVMLGQKEGELLDGQGVGADGARGPDRPRRDTEKDRR